MGRVALGDEHDPGIERSAAGLDADNLSVLPDEGQDRCSGDERGTF
jgi:hypothetical protein